MGRSEEDQVPGEFRTEERAILLDQIESSWQELWQTVNIRDEDELTGRRDAGGWSTQDHLAHLAAWERSVVSLLDGGHVAAGLGVTSRTWEGGDYDVINAEIHERVRHRSLVEVTAELRGVHAELLARVVNIDDERLREPVGAEDLVDKDVPMTLGEKIIANTTSHFDEHRGWIEELLGGKSQEIVRIWRGVTPAAKADAYLDYLQQTGLSDYAKTPGNLGVQVLRRTVGERAEFVLTTRWNSWDAIRAFAGSDPEIARYYPEDDAFLLWREPNVEHYELLVDIPGGQE